MKTFFEPKGLSPSRSQDHHIPLLSRSVPPNIRPYHTLMCRKKRLKNWSMGCLQLVASKRALVIFLHQFTCDEKNTSQRMFVDYRALNNNTIKDKFPILVIDELLDELHGAQFFSKLNLRSCYHQIEVHIDNIHKIAFRTYERHYEFLVMPFGLTNSPSTFQDIMNEIFMP